MDTAGQALACAEADLDAPHARFIELFHVDIPSDRHVLVLGRMPAGVDGARAGRYHGTR